MSDLKKAADILRSLPAGDVTRRQFVTTALAAGFAMAVQPVAAGTLTTDDTGLVAGEIQIPLRDGTMPGYRAMPKDGHGFPIVLVVQEIFGVHEHIKDVSRRLGKLGYLAVAPELYFRQGDVSKLSSIDEIRTKVVSKVSDAQVLSDLDASAAWARSSGNGQGDKLGITGFCWGGRIVWMYAAHNPHLKTGVSWYGRLTGPTNDLQPKHPIDVAGSLKAPVLGLYGGADDGIPNETVEQMRAALKASNSPSEIVVYPNTPHGFHADYRPSYRKEQAEDGWKRLREWFKRYGVA